MRGCLAVLSLSAGAAVLSGSNLAHADPTGPGALPIQIISVKTDDADDHAEALTVALKSEVRKLRGWSLGEGDYSLEVLTLALRCPTPMDTACEQRIADQIKASRFIWGTVKKAAGHRIAGALHWWTRDGKKTNTDLSYSDNLTEPSDEALRKVAASALLALTGGPPQGSVAVSAGNVTGQVFVDGQDAGAIKDGRTTLSLPIGAHKVEVRASGYAPTSGDVNIVPGSSVSLGLAPQPAQAAPAVAETPSSTNARSIAAYGALATGGIFVIGGIYSSFKVSSINNRDGFVAYRSGIAGDVCDAAKAGVIAQRGGGPVAGAWGPAEVDGNCSTAKTFTALQWVFYGLGALSVGAGTYLLMTEERGQGKTPPASARIQLMPFAIPGAGGGLDARITF